MNWRDVVGFEGHYQVSDSGEVRSMSMPTGGGRVSRKEPKVLKQRDPRRDGYKCVALYDEHGKEHTKYVHSLVAEAFIEKRPPGMECCHNDGNPSNNSVGNLRWDTPTGNQADRVKDGTDVRGAKHPNAKLSDEQVLEIKRRLRAGEKGVDLAREFNVSAQLVSYFKRGELRKWLEAQ